MGGSGTGQLGVKREREGEGEREEGTGDGISYGGEEEENERNVVDDLVKQWSNKLGPKYRVKVRMFIYRKVTFLCV